MRERDKEDKISSWMAIYYDNEAKNKMCKFMFVAISCYLYSLLCVIVII